jgi:hypothetical protein
MKHKALIIILLSEITYFTLGIFPGILYSTYTVMFTEILGIPRMLIFQFFPYLGFAGLLVLLFFVFSRSNPIEIHYSRNVRLIFLGWTLFFLLLATIFSSALLYLLLGLRSIVEPTSVSGILEAIVAWIAAFSGGLTILNGSYFVIPIWKRAT